MKSLWDPVYYGVAGIVIGLGIIGLNASFGSPSGVMDVLGYVIAGIGGWFMTVAAVALGVHTAARNR